MAYAARAEAAAVAAANLRHSFLFVGALVSWSFPFLVSGLNHMKITLD